MTACYLHDSAHMRLAWLCVTSFDQIFLPVKCGRVRRYDGWREDRSCRGRVTRVSDDAGVRIVDCEIWTENQEGERKLVGSALLALPRG